MQREHFLKGRDTTKLEVFEFGNFSISAAAYLDIDRMSVALNVSHTEAYRRLTLALVITLIN